MEARIARLESDVGHIHADIAEMKGDIRSLRDKMDAMNEKINAFRDELYRSLAAAKVWALVLYIALAGSLFATLARGFGWV